MEVQILHGKRQTTLTWAVQKWLYRSRCRLGCGLGRAEGSICYMGSLWRHLANMVELSVCGGDAALCQITLFDDLWLLLLSLLSLSLSWHHLPVNEAAFKARSLVMILPEAWNDRFYTMKCYTVVGFYNAVISVIEAFEVWFDTR